MKRHRDLETVVDWLRVLELEGHVDQGILSSCRAGASHCMASLIAEHGL